MKNVLNIIVPVLFCFLVGYTASRFQASAIEEWYPTLSKSPLTPPDSIFPIAWSILYLFMGVSLGLILNSGTSNKYFFIIVFSLQLLFNFLWSILFFSLNNPFLGIIDIVILDFFVFIYLVGSFRVSKAAFILFLLYLLWLLFATYLNAYIFLNN
ncbi:MAG: tryptophan-rich sensory protein [Candidatus Azobacteroides sp.]|nr:tryptophan-rich sensory protein [Candidatus Azobacteroides sp.]